ncbi:L-glutaminase [Maribacter orientalis]|uniref:Glutaminase n=1 Tax=Maribacter orientalis TaxID=228957 RepID=A0A1H7F5C1_9FLAO|nr:glutaminase [Maribacter orientalis]SEK19210.1 L-glutaminase [Maribacter orientalis]|tara:strand:+ start:403 stop:1317 length:915 start_codon:yes stop_codon:yes gene_type:complete
MKDFQRVLDTINETSNNAVERGTIANYIPELAKIDMQKFGIHLIDIGQHHFSAGKGAERFSIQSISKVLTLSMALGLIGENIWERIDVEPSGDPFNHLSLLELENGIPRNPLINPGAIVVADILVSQLADPKKEFLAFVRNIANDDSIDYDEDVAQSERRTGFRNYAAANLLKSYGNLKNDVDIVLDFYFHQCSLSMSCEQLANTFFMFINRGNCRRGNTFLTMGQVKRINALMLTCGFYDESGEFAFEVGLPGKSGVGGGIVALLPNKFCVATWSPGLNKKGNSKLGMLALERLTTETELSIF